MQPEIRPALQPLNPVEKAALFRALAQQQAPGGMVECLIATALKMAAEG
jgi:hypothetical protein